MKRLDTRARLTPREQRAYQFLVSYKGVNGDMPTREQIGRHLGLKSPRQGGHAVLVKLEKKGYIKRGEGWRSIIIV